MSVNWEQTECYLLIMFQDVNCYFIQQGLVEKLSRVCECTSELLCVNTVDNVLEYVFDFSIWTERAFV